MKCQRGEHKVGGRCVREPKAWVKVTNYYWKNKNSGNEILLDNQYTGEPWIVFLSDKTPDGEMIASVDTYKEAKEEAIEYMKKNPRR